MSVIKDFKRLIIGLVKIRNELGTEFVDTGVSRPIGVDDDGILLTRLTGNSTADIVDVISGGSDDQAPERHGHVSHSFNYGYDSAELNWDRLRTISDDFDGNAPAIEGVLSVGAKLYGYDRLANAFDRIDATEDTSDNLAINNRNFLNTAAFAFGWDQINQLYRRVRVEEDADNVISTGTFSLLTINKNTLFDETADRWRRERANSAKVLLTSAIRSTTTQSVAELNVNFRGVHVIIDTTAVSGTGSITPVIQGFDNASGKYYDLLVGPAITAIGTTVIKLYPGITTSANAAASDILPRTWRVEVQHADASDYTYSVGANPVV